VCRFGRDPPQTEPFAKTLEFVQRCKVIDRGRGIGRDCIDGKANDCQPEVQILTLNELNFATTSNFHKKGSMQLASVCVVVVVVLAACIY